MFTEKGGLPNKKDRIMSEALLKGLTSANVTKIMGNLPCRPKS